MLPVNPIYEFELFESDRLTIVVSNLVMSSVKAKQNAVKWTMVQVIPSYHSNNAWTKGKAESGEWNCCWIPEENHLAMLKFAEVLKVWTQTRWSRKEGPSLPTSDKTTDHVACAGGARCTWPKFLSAYKLWVLRSCSLQMYYKLCCMWWKPVWNIKSNDLGPDNAHCHLAPQPCSISQESKGFNRRIVIIYNSKECIAQFVVVN